MKPDGSIHLCGDYKVTINQAIKMDTHPQPKIEDLFASLAHGKTFSKLDLAQAYLQVPLEEASKRYVTINTHKGLYQYSHLSLILEYPQHPRYSSVRWRESCKAHLGNGGNRKETPSDAG